MQEQPVNSSSTGDSLKEFQLSDLSISDKSSTEFGNKISKKIWGMVISGIGGYYYNRNQRFIQNRNWAAGRIDVQQMFQDRFEFNGKPNYIKLKWNTLQLVNRIVTGLVGRWMARGEKITATAIDNLSQTQKREEYEQLEFIIEQRAQLEQLQQQSGVQMIPNDDLPADKDELILWKQQFQRTPEEIEQELLCNEVLGANGWNDVLKEKALHDSAEVGLVGTYTWMDDDGIIHVEWVKPENMIYSASDYPDFRDSSWIGEIGDIKISELRRRYGKEFNPNNPNALSEQQLWEIAQTCKEYKSVTNLSWDMYGMGWSVPFSLRPYDEWNARKACFELRSVDSEPITITKSKTTGTTYTQKGYPTTASGKRREKPSDNQKVVDDTNINIYRGVYLPDNDILIEWGIKTNMIRPQDPKEAGNAEFSYSYYMYQNYQMRNLAIPEKIEAAIDNMILALLKIQHVVARMRPTGAAIDESALQNIDYGLGDAGNKDIDYKKLYDQTGDIYYRGVDVEGNRVPVPITELQNSGFLGQMQGLIQNYQFWYQTLKDELGEDPNMITAAVQPRVTAQNVEASQQASEFATDYMYRAFAEVMKMTARKISCLGKDSIMYGANAYRNIVKQEVDDRIFSTDIKFLPTDQEVARFENIMNQAIAVNQELIQFLDPFRLLRIAREDVKLAELLFRQAQKKLIIYQQQTAQQNQQATFEAQMASAQETGKMDIMKEQEKGKIDLLKIMIQGDSQSKNTVLAGIFQLYLEAQKNGSVLPTELIPIARTALENVAVPAMVENEQRKQQILGEIDQMMQQQQAEQEQQQNQSQPQEQVA